MGRPSEYRYTESHEWVRVDGDVAVVGITDYAVKALRDLVALDFEAEDGDIAKGETLAVIESVKAASDIYAPVSGEILEVNAGLGDDIDVLQGDAFDAGWMVKIKMSDPGQVKSLLTLEQYEATLDKK